MLTFVTGFEHKFAVAVQVNTSVPKDIGKPLARVLAEAAQLIQDQRQKHDQ